MDRSIDRRCRRQLGRSTRGDRSLHDTNRGYVKTSWAADGRVDLEAQSHGWAARWHSARGTMTLRLPQHLAPATSGSTG